MVTPVIARPPARDVWVKGDMRPAGVAPTMRRLVGEQVVVLAAQALSGLGNFAFLLVALHWLPAGSFAPLATFLALYLLVQLPANGLSAGSSMLAGARSRRVGGGVAVGLACGVALAATSHWVAPVLHLSPRLLVLLALAMPLAPPLALARGRLFGQTRPMAVAATLVAEPVVRLTIGLVLLSAFGVVGGAFGVVLAGYFALAVAWIATRRFDSRVTSRAPAARLPWLVVVGYLGFAVVQNQDLVLANGLLSASTAGMFAALSTIGGIAAFATANIPLVLMPRAGSDLRRARQATVVALTFAVVIGVVLVAAVAMAPRAWLAAVVGQRYVDIATMATPYVAAMGLLGVARVIGARLLAAGRGRAVTTVVGAAVAVQATAICLAPRTVRGVALSTVLAIGLMTLAMAAVATLPERKALVADTAPGVAEVAEPANWRQRVSLRTVALVGLLTAAALALRLMITRGLWLDEATSVQQARMPFGQMLHNLRTTDVHPPGYFTVLWGWIRIFGDGPLSVRMPSIIFGVALIPVLYLVGRDLYGRRTGIVAAVFGVVAPQLVWYSQEARMYGPFMLLVTLSVWAQLRALRSGSRRAWLTHGLLCALMLWTQYFTAVVIVTQQVATVAVLASRRRRREPVRADVMRWLGAMALLVVVVAPLVPFAVHQFDVNQAAGRGFGSAASNARQVSQPGTGLSAYTVLANLLWAVWGYHSNATMTALGALWPAGMLLALALLGRGRSRTTQVLIAVAIVPIAVMYLVGVEKRFLFDLRYFIGCVPLLVLLAARAVTSWARSRVAMTVIAGVAVVSLGVGLADQQLNGSNPRRYDFQAALSTIAARATSSDGVVLAPQFLHPLVSYYQPQLRSVDERRQTAATVSVTANDSHVFVLGSFFDVNGERQQVNALLARYRSSGRQVMHTWHYANVKVWELQ